jgi:hypothetical protein
MYSAKTQRLSLLVMVALLVTGILACDFGQGAGTATPQATLESPGVAKPQVTLESPPSGIELRAGQQVQVACIVEDPKGVVSVELAVDGARYATESSPNPQGQPQWKFVEIWTATAEPGLHTLTITAWNVDKVASDPVSISVTVVEAAVPGATGVVTLATDTPVAPGITAAAPSSGATETPFVPAATPTAGAAVPTHTAAAPPPTNTPVPPPATNTPVEAPPTNTPVPPPTSTPVPALPDLIIYAIYLSRDTVPYGETVHATVMVVNQGNAPAGPFRVSWDFGSGSGGQNVPGLAPNQSYPLEWDSLPLYESYDTRAMADESQVVPESNEGNNVLLRRVTVLQPLPDLTLGSVGDVADAHSGEELLLEPTVWNHGNVMSGSFAVVLTFQWANGGSDRCEWEISAGVLPNQEREMPTYCQVRADPPGEWRLVIDPDNRVQESNEGNNTAAGHTELAP